MNKTNDLNLLLETLATRFPGETTLRQKNIREVAKELGMGWGVIKHIVNEDSKVAYGLYAIPTPENQSSAPTPVPTEHTSAQIHAPIMPPLLNRGFVKFGEYAFVESIMKSRQFFPLFVVGASGFGKTEMFEHICAVNKIPLLREQISAETDKDTLIGGLRLKDGNTYMHEGPVIRAARAGAVLLLDEIDRGNNNLLCLQNVLEGKPFTIPNTNEVITPAPGFTIVATGNTRGSGSVDGKFSGASILDSALIERFAAMIPQGYPSIGQERDILKKWSKAQDVNNDDFIDSLVTWSKVIRETNQAGGIEDIISPRRLVMILRIHGMTQSRTKAIEYAINRFDEETREAMLDLYTKIDPTT